VAHFEIFKNKKGQYRWRLRATNCKIIADSADCCVRKSARLRGIKLVKYHSRKAKIADKTLRVAKRKKTVEIEMA